METKTIPSSSLYFPNLNGLRFIAASMVMVAHIEQVRSYFSLPNRYYTKTIYNLGTNGVILFFVLSGFLITSLLIKENAVTGTIRIRNFYMRRILRIWPLYFLIVIGSLFILPFITSIAWPGFDKQFVWHNLSWKLLLFVFLLPNVAQNVFGMVPFAAQTWSIGVEEQFYLIWPVMMKKTGSRWSIVMGTIIVYVFVLFVFEYLVHAKGSKGLTAILYGYWITTQFECLAIGAAYALVVTGTTRTMEFLKKILFNKWLQWIVLLLTIGFVAIGFQFKYLNFASYSFLFGFIITNLAVNPKRIISLEWKPLHYLGKISYGLYMYHLLAITLSIKIVLLFHFYDHFLLYPISFLVTIIFASLSYKYFEVPFLRRKLKYSKILSGDDGIW
jgi:peptidoglycan/LPS O-acetylase OafA/YrhL